MNHVIISGQSSPGRENSRSKGLEGAMSLADGSDNKKGLWEQQGTRPRDWGDFVRLCEPSSKFGLYQNENRTLGKKHFGRKMIQTELCLEVALTALWRMDSTGQEQKQVNRPENY